MRRAQSKPRSRGALPTGKAIPKENFRPSFGDGQNDPNLPAINLTGSGSRWETEKRITASSSFAFGGSNCVLIIG
uniref:Yersiniabactin biosynthetic protein n=1 Tax=Neisseria meningitidis alpha275 TaxID=295996 RepID=C6SGJ1_NEIME|nr:yersiniabactin biosynthetic protein [Neisseria meningitidis alpha275]